MKKISLLTGMMLTAFILMAGTALAAAQLTLSSDMKCDQLTIGSGDTLDVDGDHTIFCAGNWSNSGTFSKGTGTVNLDGEAQSMTGINAMNNLTVSNSGIKTIAMGAGGTTISGTGTISDSAQVLLTPTATAENKVYNGTTDATANVTSDNIFTGYSFEFSYSSAFASKNVGSDIEVTVSGI